jgi:hypothetical protein
MTKRTRTLGACVGAALVLLSAGCKPNLDVTNPNEPDVARALATSEDVKGLAISSVHSWYIQATDYEPWLMLQVTADASTANYGNFGMRFNNLEPRIPYENNSAGGDRGVTESPWYNGYAALGAANDAIRAIDKGLVFDKDPATSAAQAGTYRRLAQFTQAAVLGELAMTFDKAFILDEASDPNAKQDLKPYKDVSAAAVAKWAALATAEVGQSDDFDKSVIPLDNGTFTSSKIGRIANTMAALTLAYTPRTAAEAATVDWARVAAFADKGIGTGSGGAPFDFTVVGDFSNWFSGLAELGEGISWTRVDMRLICRMAPGDPLAPCKYSGTLAAKATSPDARFTTDIGFRAKPLGDPNRGIYMQSQYYRKRYYYYSSDGDDELGPAPYLLAAESDLVRAEALVRSGGSLITAANLINNTRVGRGNLPPATAADGATTLLADIDYERDVELLNTNGFTLFIRRHVDGLQSGTVKHLPIPAKELEVLGLPVYTFGSPGKEMSLMGVADGTNASAILAPTVATRSLALPNGQVMDLHVPLTVKRRRPAGHR